MAMDGVAGSSMDGSSHHRAAYERMSTRSLFDESERAVLAPASDLLPAC
jgi:hypothetical protein